MEEEFDYSWKLGKDLYLFVKIIDTQTNAEKVRKIISEECYKFPCIGFLTESYSQGKFSSDSLTNSKRVPIDLVHIAVPRSGFVFVFRLDTLKVLPPFLRSLLEDCSILKITAFPEPQNQCLLSYYGVEVANSVDIRRLLNTKKDLGVLTADHLGFNLCDRAINEFNCFELSITWYEVLYPSAKDVFAVSEIFKKWAGLKFNCVGSPNLKWKDIVKKISETFNGKYKTDDEGEGSDAAIVVPEAAAFPPAASTAPSLAASAILVLDPEGSFLRKVTKTFADEMVRTGKADVVTIRLSRQEKEEESSKKTRPTTLQQKIVPKNPTERLLTKNRMIKKVKIVAPRPRKVANDKVINQSNETPPPWCDDGKLKFDDLIVDNNDCTLGSSLEDLKTSVSATKTALPSPMASLLRKVKIREPKTVFAPATSSMPRKFIFPIVPSSTAVSLPMPTDASEIEESKNPTASTPTAENLMAPSPSVVALPRKELSPLPSKATSWHSPVASDTEDSSPYASSEKVMARSPTVASSTNQLAVSPRKTLLPTSTASETDESISSQLAALETKAMSLNEITVQDRKVLKPTMSASLSTNGSLSENIPLRRQTAASSRKRSFQTEPATDFFPSFSKDTAPRKVLLPTPKASYATVATVPSASERKPLLPTPPAATYRYFFPSRKPLLPNPVPSSATRIYPLSLMAASPRTLPTPVVSPTVNFFPSLSVRRDFLTSLMAAPPRKASQPGPTAVPPKKVLFPSPTAQSSTVRTASSISFKAPDSAAESSLPSLITESAKELVAPIPAPSTKVSTPSEVRASTSMDTLQQSVTAPVLTSGSSAKSLMATSRGKFVTPAPIAESASAEASPPSPIPRSATNSLMAASPRSLAVPVPTIVSALASALADTSSPSPIPASAITVADPIRAATSSRKVLAPSLSAPSEIKAATSMDISPKWVTAKVPTTVSATYVSLPSLMNIPVPKPTQDNLKAPGVSFPEICVLCGSRKNILRKKIVPQGYIKHIRRICGDSNIITLPMCPFCDRKSTSYLDKFRATLKYVAGVPIKDKKTLAFIEFDLASVTMGIGSKVTSVTRDFLRLSLNWRKLEPEEIKRLTGAAAVVGMYVLNGIPLTELEKLFCRAFKEAMRPRTLPSEWYSNYLV